MAEKDSELESYMRAFKKYPPLTEREEFDRLFDDWKNGNDEARDFLVYGNIRLVLSVALRHTRRGLPLLDMLQEGVVGLMRALEKFDPNMGTRFSTYAVWWIRQAITRAIIDLGEKRPYRIPVHLQERINVVLRAMESLFKKNGCLTHGPEILEEIRELGRGLAVGNPDDPGDPGDSPEIYETFTLDQVQECMRLIGEGYVSLQDKIANDSEGVLVETAIQDTKVDIETAIEAKRLLAEYEKALDRIDAVIDKLDGRAGAVLRLRFGLVGLPAMTLEEVGRRFDVTRERIRQIEAKALSYINEALGLESEQIEQIINVVDELRVIASS